jgi:broad specificity phosphatase PhoE
MRLNRLSLAMAASIALALPVAAQPSTVIVVRHAEKAPAPANDPVLSAEGIQRSLDLGTALAGTRVTSVVTTHLQRTKLTAKAVTDAMGKEPIVVPASSPTTAHVEAVAAAVRARPAGEVVLVVGHSNTVPAIVAALGGPKMPDLCDAQYSMMFILEFLPGSPPRLIKAKYGAADPPNADGCPRPGM